MLDHERRSFARPAPLPLSTPEPATLDDVRREMEALLAGAKSATLADLSDTLDAAHHDLGALMARRGDMPTRDAPAQAAQQTARRKELYEILHPETSYDARPGRAGKCRQGGDNSADRFTADTAERTGRDALVGGSKSVNVTDLPAEPDTAARARTLHLRRQLTAAVERGADFLAALGLPRPVDGDFIAIDPRAAGDALEAAIGALDALDDDPEAEPSLGWYATGNGVVFLGDASDCEAEAEHDEDDGTAEPSLASPERYPSPPMYGFPGVYPDRGSDDSQLRWAEGAQHDGEAVDEDGDDLDAGEHDTADMEPSIGRPEDPDAVLSDAPGADTDAEADDSELDDDRTAEDSGLRVWVFGPSRAEAAHG